MKPAIEAARTYVRLVRDGYERCAAPYNATRSQAPVDLLATLIERLPEGSRVLDLGCGAGVPVTRALAGRFRTVGVDLSRSQLSLARRQVPDADLLLGDMSACAFAPVSFDAIVSFYAIFHLPRSEHASLFRRIHDWLRPGGYLLASLAWQEESGYTEHDFFGVEMFWSNFGIEDYRRMLAGCGFVLLDEQTVSYVYDEADLPTETHPIVLAQRAGNGPANDEGSV